MPVAISKLCGCAVGLACVLAISSAKADIVFCNKFAHMVYVAIAYPQDNGTWVSRGWLGLDTGECSQFDTALHVKTFYYRGESVDFRDPSGGSVKNNWGSGKKFAMFEDGNFNYWNAQKKVLDSSLADFSKGAETDGDAVSATVTFEANGKFSSVDIK